LKAIAPNPRIPITPLTTRMNGEILFCSLKVYGLIDTGCIGSLAAIGVQPAQHYVG
jgi:hypothetical protein